MAKGWNLSKIKDLLDQEQVKEQEVSFHHSPIFLQLYIAHPRGKKHTATIDNGLVFYSIKGRDARVFKPLGSGDERELYRGFSEFLEELKSDVGSITVHGVPDRLNLIKEVPGQRWKGFTEHVFDMDRTLSMKGRSFKPLREKIKQFQRSGHEMRSEELSNRNVKDANAIFEKWVHARGIRNIYGLEERVKGLKNVLKDIKGTVYYLEKEPVAVQAAYEVPGGAAHFLGLCTRRIPGLNESVQLEFWKEISKEGIKYVNDGPTGRSALGDYKKKFGPVKTFRVFQGTWDKI
jgi:hypothetical protein